MSFDTISVIGLGYIGLLTAAMFASKEKQVIGVDVSQHAVETINAGRIHIVEPDLGGIVEWWIRVFKSSDINTAGRCIFDCSANPVFASYGKRTRYPNRISRILNLPLSQLLVLKKEIQVFESTSVGATEQMSKWLAEERSDRLFLKLMVRNPTFVLLIVLSEFFQDTWFVSSLKMIESSEV